MKFKVSNQTITITEGLHPVSDTENIYEAEYEFAEDWDGFQRTAVFEGNGSSYNVVLGSDNKCSIPNEILAEPGFIRFGVLGTKTVGSVTKRYPTVWSEKIFVDEASAGTETPGTPTPDVYVQILSNEAALAEDIAELEVAKHTHANKSIIDAITQSLVNAWTAAGTWVSTYGSTVASHITDAVKHITANERSTWNAKQDALVSGTNIRTLNNIPLLGSGNIAAVSSVNTRTGAVTLTAGDVGALPDTTPIPSKTSDLTNDSGFIDKNVNDLTNYYTRSDTYTRSEISSAIENHHDSTKANVSDLATVATSGNYNDLINKPTIPTHTSELTNDSGFSVVSVSATGTATDEVEYITVNGTEKKIKSGDDAVWGNITGTLANQTDLKTALDAKIEATSATLSTSMPVDANTLESHPANYFQPMLTAGANITISNNVISASGGGSQLYAHYLLIYESAFGSAMYTTIISDSITPITADSLYTYLYNNGTALTIPITGKGKCNESGAERSFVASYITVGNTDTFSYYGLKGTVYTNDSKVYYDFVGYSNMAKTLFEVTDKVVEI